MYKKFFFFMFCFCYSITYSQQINKNLKVIYGKLFSGENDSIKDVKLSPWAKNTLSSIKESIKKTEYTLWINDDYAKFEYNDVLQDENFNDIAINFGGGETHFYDFKNDKVFKYNFTKSKLVEYDKDSISWEFTNDYKDISGNICFRAIGKTKIYNLKSKLKKEIEYDVWYCPQYSNTCGPAQFFGLPGLVFEASQKNSGLKFYLKKIEYIDKLNITIPNIKVISEEEDFLKTKKTFGM